MMLLLPLQWSWAVAASVCEHEKSATHVGHHEHQHVDAGASSTDISTGDATPSGQHADCHVCHGAGVACTSDAGSNTRLWSRSGPPPAAGHHVPEPPIEGLLRPPARLVA